MCVTIPTMLYTKTILDYPEKPKSPAYKMTGRDYVRELVRARDKYTCQMCGKLWQEGTRRFDVHHLQGLCGKKSKGIDRKQDMPILIALCHKCHFNHHLFSRYLSTSKTT